jgi:hypothetical protein
LAGRHPGAASFTATVSSVSNGSSMQTSSNRPDRFSRSKAAGQPERRDPTVRLCESGRGGGVFDDQGSGGLEADPWPLAAVISGEQGAAAES